MQVPAQVDRINGNVTTRDGGLFGKLMLAVSTNGAFSRGRAQSLYVRGSDGRIYYARSATGGNHVSLRELAPNGMAYRRLQKEHPHIFRSVPNA